MSIQSCEACGNPLDPAARHFHPGRRFYDPFEFAIRSSVLRCPSCGRPVKLERPEERPDHTTVCSGDAVPADR